MIERIAIVGGGASGLLVAAELLRRAAGPLEVVVLEPRSALGRGPAYATPCPLHLLNVPAGRLSARPDEAGHFLAWLRRHDPQASAASFVPRSLYGRYLEDVLAQARTESRGPARVEHLQEDVVALAASGDGFEVFLACGPPFRAERVVLALGNLPPDTLARLAPLGLDPARYVRDPWAPRALDFPDPGGAVVVLGTGLTAVDVALALRHRGHEGRVVAVSRRGLLPREHPRPIDEAEAPSAADAEEAPTVRGLLAEVRARAYGARARGGSGLAAVDALRSRSQALWQALSPADRTRFLRHVQPYWDVHRHRMPPDVAAAVRGMLEWGSLTLAAGRVQAVSEHAAGVHVHFQPRGARSAIVLEARHVVDCTGPAPVSRTPHPLLRSLVAAGLVRPDAFGLGLDATSDGRVVSPAHPRGELYAIGPLLKGALWETTAIEELRTQAVTVAAMVLAPRPVRGIPSATRPALGPIGAVFETAGGVS